MVKIWKNLILGAGKIKKILWILGNHAFLVLLIIILLEIFAGGILYYEYVFSAEKQEPNISDNSFQFKESVYQKILLEWQKRAEKLQGFALKIYSSPF